MTFSFHTEFRDGDYVASMVCKVLVEEMGFKDLHVVAIIEARDGTILDVVRQIKPYSF